MILPSCSVCGEPPIYTVTAAGNHTLRCDGNPIGGEPRHTLYVWHASRDGVERVWANAVRGDGPALRRSIIALRDEFQQCHDDTMSNRCHEDQEACSVMRSTLVDAIAGINRVLAEPDPLDGDEAERQLIEEAIREDREESDRREYLGDA